MERFGRPDFQRGAAAPKPYGTRAKPTQNRSGSLLGQPSRQSGDQFGSYQNSKPGQRSNVSSGSMLAGSLGSGSRTSSSSRQDNDSVPAEVRHLMQTLGLSQSDMQKLSQLPEKDLSVNNLAKAIGDLKQGKQNVGKRSGSFASPSNPIKRSESFQKGRDQNVGYRSNDGILGKQPNQHNFQGRSGQRSPSGNRSFGGPPSRHQPSPKATVKPAIPPLIPRSRLSDPKSGSSFGDRREFSSKGQRDEYQDEQRLYGRRRSADHPDPSRNHSFSSQSRRSNESNFNSREGLLHSKAPAQYGNERRVVREREPQGRELQSRRPVGTRNVSKPSVASTLPSLLDMPLPQKSRNTGSGILGSGPQQRSHGLDNLIAAVGNESLLTPLMLATQTDPSVFEAQIQAMKVLQAQAIKMQSGSGPREKERPMRRSPPPSRASLIERRMIENARREAQAMRSAKGRVLYIKYKSPRVLEKDLRQLASAFGRVTKLFIIKPKIKNGHFQAFMEMDSWDCAAAMLERYIAKPPNIKGCPVDVQRSNYDDLQPKFEQMRSVKRRRSMSPIRKGTTQLPTKRERRSDDKLSLSITTSRSERRIVSHSDDRDVRSKSQDKKKTDAREILNRRNTRDSGKRKSESGSQSANSDENAGAEADEDKAVAEENTSVEAKKEVDAEKSKEEFDPLDALADELALHDEFVLMDEVGYDKLPKKKQDDEYKKGEMDLDEGEFDLEDVKVEMSQDEHPDEEALDSALEDRDDADETEESVVVSVVDEIIDAVLHQIEETGQASLDEEMAAMQEFNVSEDEIHEYVYPEEAQPEENGNEYQDDQQADDEEEAEESMEDSTSDAVEARNRIILKEILEAKDHLDALVKVTKAKAAQACAKKLRVCLEVAISHLEGGEGE